MSTSRLPEQLATYVAERATPDDAFLIDLKRESETAGLPAIWIGAHQAAAMALLLQLMNAREVVEVGTLGGYSAICMARALPANGRVRTIELDPRHAEAWFVLGQMEDSEGRRAEAIELWRRSALLGFQPAREALGEER